MGIEIGAQLDALWRALFLGAAFALLYDGLRALRLRRRTRRALTDLLDALYCLFLAAALLAFTLRIGQGELRLRRNRRRARRHIPTGSSCPRRP